MTAKVTFFPTGNADCCRIDLVGGRKVLVDFADTRDPKDPYDKRIDLAGEVRRDLDDADRDYLDVVCYTHLDTDHVKGEARHRLREEEGIKVFSRPERPDGRRARVMHRGCRPDCAGLL
jgi:glyoxylase-like metal-dependent hydrolase (beta-lactamase superfamily II)